MDGAVGESGRYAERWSAWAARDDHGLENSELIHGRPGTHSVTYTVVMQPGRTTFDEAVSRRGRIAAALGVDVSRLVFERAAWLNDASRFELTIIEEQVIDSPRFAREPVVSHGAVLDAARFADGRGRFGVTMWKPETGRTVPVGLVGAPDSGRSNAVRQLTAGAQKSQAMNVLVVDPSGFRERELRRHARVALVGEQGASRVWEVLEALVAARRRRVQELGQTTLMPTASTPGWMVAFTDFGRTMSSGRVVTERLTRYLRDCDHLGFWTVAVNDTMTGTAWGTADLRSRFEPQLIAFLSSTWSSRDLPQMDERRADAAPAGAVGCSMANFGSRPNVPLRWDVQAEQVGSAEDVGLDDVLQRHRLAAPVDPDDVAAITDVLGEPTDGRWDVGAGCSS